MGHPPAVCSACGLRFPATAFSVSNATDISFSGCGTNCPRCGADAQIVDGTYDFVGDTIAAFRAPGVTRQKIERFREIAENVKAGELTATEATSEAAQLGAAFATVWNWTNANAGAISVLIALITAFLMIYYEAESDSAAEEVQRQAQRQTQVLELMHEELRRQSADVPANLLPPPPTGSMRKVAPTQTPVTAKPNRAERRKAAAIARQNKE